MKEFSGLMIQALAERGSCGWSVNASKDHLLSNGPNDVINVSNMYQDFRNAHPSVWTEMLRSYVSALLQAEQEIPKSWDVARKNIYVVVRSREVRLSEPHGASSTPTNLLTRRPFVDDLELVLVYDAGDALRYVDDKQLSQWGQSTDIAFEQALQNLCALKTPRWTTLKDGVFRLRSEVSYEESFLLVDRVMDQLPASMVCMPVNRGVLLAANSHSDTAVATLLKEARRSFKTKPWPMSPAMLVREDGRWQSFQASPAVSPLLEDLKRSVNEMHYATQLTALLDAGYVDHFLARYSVMKWPAGPGSNRSVCSWTEGAPSSLPKTDFVAFVRQLETSEFRVTLVAWDVVVGICGHLMRKTEGDLPRFIVDSFPSDSELAILEAYAEEPMERRH
jgi:hypothetical protein